MAKLDPIIRGDRVIDPAHSDGVRDLAVTKRTIVQAPPIAGTATRTLQVPEAA
jgi:hypothetical protein